MWDICAVGALWYNVYVMWLRVQCLCHVTLESMYVYVKCRLRVPYMCLFWQEEGHQTTFWGSEGSDSGVPHSISSSPQEDNNASPVSHSNSNHGTNTGNMSPIRESPQGEAPSITIHTEKEDEVFITPATSEVSVRLCLSSNYYMSLNWATY